MWRAMAYRYRARTCPGVLPQLSKAERAAATAASTSALLAEAICVSGLPVAGLMLSIYCPLAGLTHELLINNSNGVWAAIHANPGAAASGAGPYSIVLKISMTFIPSLLSSHRIVMGRGIVAGDEVRELALNIGKQTAGTNAEQPVAQPFVAQFFFH